MRRAEHDEVLEAERPVRRQQFGGLHAFEKWDRPILTDSGGFQVYSLIRQDPTAGTIRPNEVIFKEASTGEKVILSPEKVILSQLQLGSDILYCLDDCTDAEVDAAEQAQAVERTIRWAAKGRATFDAQVRPTTKRASRHGTVSDDTEARDGTRPYLFGVVQGGGSEALRRECAQALVSIGFDGFGYGGWPLTPDGNLRTDILGAVAEALPAGTGPSFSKAGFSLAIASISSRTNFANWGGVSTDPTTGTWRARGCMSVWDEILSRIPIATAEKTIDDPP